MGDPKVEKLAKILVNYSINVKKGEYIKISSSTQSKPLILELYKEIIKKNAYPIINIGFSEMSYIFFKNASDKQLKHFPKLAWEEVKKIQAYVGIGAPYNTRDLANIDPKKIAIRNKATRKITEYVVNEKAKIRRTSMEFPTSALAQDADMSLEEYENFYYNACLQNWKKLSKRMYQVKRILDKGKEVRIIGKDTDIKIGIKNRPFVVDDGRENMPGGEIFNAPLEKTVEGHIRFTYPAIRDGKEVTNIYLEFKKGKIVKATADKNLDFLKKMIKTDKGSEYLGELGIGFNPKITKFTKNLLFDEKLQATIHLALGMSYKECKGTNKSALHWDIVKDLKKGGQIILDGKIIQKNGKWLI